MGDQGEFGPALERAGTLEMAGRMEELTGLSGQWQNPGVMANSGNSGEMDDAGETLQ